MGGLLLAVGAALGSVWVLSLGNSVVTVPAVSHTLITDRRAREDESPVAEL